MVAAPTPENESNPIRAFGRFELRQLLGKSGATMSWLVFDPQAAQEVLLYMPRMQPANAQSLQTWLYEVRLVARLDHPHLARAVEVDVQDHWPYVAVSRALGQTFAEWMLSNPKPAPGEVVDLICQALEGLAFAHEAGVVHGDLQLHNLLVNERGHVSVAGFDVAVGSTDRETDVGARRHTDRPHDRAGAADAQLDPRHPHARRSAAERDVLAVGLLLHHMIAGQPALDQADTASVIERLPPQGREIVRLPWGTPHPIAEALRTIANRAADHQPRQRYLNARTLLRALEGWRASDAMGAGSPVEILLDRLRTVGHLPALPHVGAIVAHLSHLEGQRTDEIAKNILQDMALSFELLRQVNSALVQGAQVSGNAAVLTVRRAVALVGINGVRQAVTSLRAWPGPLNEGHAAALSRLMERVRMAGYTAQALRPAGYDEEVIFLIALLQNLGRLMLQYHFADEAQQVRHLMQAVAPAELGGPELPGMSEEDASIAVLGVSVESLGLAVANQWGLSGEVQSMIRRVRTSRPVRPPEDDASWLCVAASAANEAVDAVTLLPAHKVGKAVTEVALRYARALSISPRNLRDALQGARAAMDTGAAVTPLAMDDGAASEGAGSSGRLFDSTEPRQADSTPRVA